ncbi:MAG: serine hydrolase domain-containing protein [Flavobacteriaceae bacterium]
MKKAILIILMMAALFSCKSPAEQKAEIQALAFENLQSQIDSLFNQNIDANGPGAALLVSYEGEMLIGNGYGLRDLETNAPITPATNMRMASVSKQFTNLCILTLVDQGKLALTDSLYHFWTYPVFKDITVQQLIDHTSGIADYDAAFMEDWDRSKIVENRDVLDWLATDPPPLFQAGTKWEYSNTAYLVLALLVEKVSGQEFSAYAKKQVFDKAGMSRTNFYNLAKPIDIPERANCYEKDSLGAWSKVDGFFMNGIMGDGAVYSSLNDYFEYDRALRNKTIVSKASHELIFKPTSMVLPETAKYPFPFLKGADERYAMGWFVTDDFALHSGSWYGTRTMVVRDMGRPLTLAIFLNSDDADARTKLIEGTYSLVDDYLMALARLLPLE